MSPSTTAGSQSLLEGVRSVAPLLRAHASDAERDRRLSDAVATALREQGFYRMFRPRAFGGLEVDPMTAFRVYEELSSLDSAAGWNVQLSCSWDMFGAWFPDDGAREVFGEPDTMLAGSGFPPRRADPTNGGYRVSGQQPFMSGAHQARWFLGLAHVFDGPSERLAEDGDPLTLVTACPAKEGAIVDTWHTLGMRGTGSHDVRVTDVFVPERRAPPLVPREGPCGAAYQGPLYRFSIWASIASMAPVASGIARAALDELRELATKKTPAYGAKALADRGVVQSQVAEAEAKLGAARAYFYEALEEMWDRAVEGRMIDMPHKIKIQLATTHALLAAAEVVDLVHAAAGASGIREQYRFQRHFRDVHTITQHGFASASRYESVGQLLLDRPSDWSFFKL
jgi:alkylation response protein AidB-like acyl-CoA dehydrogenase